MITIISKSYHTIMPNRDYHQERPHYAFVAFNHSTVIA